MEPPTTNPVEAGPTRWFAKPGPIAALVTVVIASALAVAVGRSDGDGQRTAAAARQVVIPPPLTTPQTETTIAAPPPEPPSTSTSTTAAPAPPATTPPRPAAAEIIPPVVPGPLTLSVALQQALAGVNGCLIVEDQDGDGGNILFDYQSGASFVPASSQKVLVAAAVLSRLGADYRYETKVVAARPPQDGVIENAWLVGGGDPYLATPEYIGWLRTRPRSANAPVTHLTWLADELVAMGVRSIPGGLQTDETRYPPQRSVPTWKPSYITEAEVGSLGALTVNEGLAGWGNNQKVSPDPAAGTATALSKLLTDRGVAVPGSPTAAGQAPSDAVVIASIKSAPVGEIVAAMLRSSDNYVAEMLVKELDRHLGGPGLTAGGTVRVVDELARLGVPVDGVHLNDGSGLDTGNRATCRALLGALNLSRQPKFSIVDSGLAIAGATGTLSKRYGGTPAAGILAAKTGWINGAAAMVGRIFGEPMRRFALLFNGQFGWPFAAKVQDRVVSALTGNLPL